VDARSLRIEVAATTSTGRRKINADAFLVDQAAGLFAVADGMGDEERSALVARMALDAVRERFGPPSLQQPLAKWTADEAAERFRRGVMAANERVRALAGGSRPPSERPSLGSWSAVIVFASRTWGTAASTWCARRGSRRG
jgi:serine/threonine protein phosphatase PrpC